MAAIPSTSENDKTPNNNHQYCKTVPIEAQNCGEFQLETNYENGTSSDETASGLPLPVVRLNHSEEIIPAELIELTKLWSTLSEQSKAALLLTAKAMAGKS